ncbi:MAG: hypothetical protein COX62_05895 [Deltaproteobacteria bacterium CG_4_10_14_0_2_um_filter_43_8]|nr:MAG: hypothetical protein COV43_07525 [Deltaproteobacteria bacterium CG11_big_fil_rev_8_21_14_0_20_42_23]PJA19833.1 MAG: hypothetical protein COX62_05895 [Deltaproteobacteria bacterium CG_4_10_14_0_2_um_filter_43_8]PJC64504.1 MAG: hypothetical protein CO021_03930 [Deltaproteobacteria bacterium CG_4_9_14_0_2_um_filter_42_21]
MTASPVTPAHLFLPAHAGLPLAFPMASPVNLCGMRSPSPQSRTTRNGLVRIESQYGRSNVVDALFTNFTARNAHFKIDLFSEYPRRDGALTATPLTTLIIGLDKFLLGILLSLVDKKQDTHLQALARTINEGTNETILPKAAVQLALSMFYHQAPGLSAHLLYLETDRDDLESYDVNTLVGNPALINPSSSTNFNLYTSDPNATFQPRKAKT